MTQAVFPGGIAFAGTLCRKESFRSRHCAGDSAGVPKAGSGIFSARRLTPLRNAAAKTASSIITKESTIYGVQYRGDSSIPGRLHAQADTPPGIADKKNIRRKNHDCTIRLEKKEDYRTVENLVRESFWNVYRPDCLEHFVLKCLRDDKDFVPELDFVLEKDGRIIGQNVFVRTAIKADNGKDVPIMTMGPICIAPSFKRQGYGRLLLDYSLEKAGNLAAVRSALRETFCFTGKAGSPTQTASGSGITASPRERMRPSSFAES